MNLGGGGGGSGGKRRQGGRVVGLVIVVVVVVVAVAALAVAAGLAAGLAAVVAGVEDFNPWHGRRCDVDFYVGRGGLRFVLHDGQPSSVFCDVGVSHQFVPIPGALQHKQPWFDRCIDGGRGMHTLDGFPTEGEMNDCTWQKQTAGRKQAETEMEQRWNETSR